MIIEISGNRPAEGGHLNIILSVNGGNICDELALKLYALYSEARQLQDKPRTPFRRNLSYCVANGLIFRLFDNEVDSPEALERSEKITK